MRENINHNFKKIYFIQIINKIWKEKLLIFLISIVFSLLSYLLSFNYQPKYSTELTINEAPISLFAQYRKIIPNKDSFQIRDLFNSILEKNFLTTDNLILFINQSTELDSFKKLLISKNITLEQYFKNNKLLLKKNEKNDTFLLIHSIELQGEFFFKNYSQYVKNISVDEIKKTLKTFLEIEIDNLKNEMSRLSNKKKYYEKFIIDNNLKDSNIYEFYLKEASNFFLQEENLLIEFNKISLLNDQLKNDNFDYKIIKKISSNQNEKENYQISIKFSLMGLIFGLFLSIVFIFLKN